MAEKESRPSIASLIGGILSDARDLFAQELERARLEIREELQKVKAASRSLAVGGLVVLLGLIMLAEMVVHLLASYGGLPLWGSYGIVGGLLAGVGAVMLLSGGKAAEDVKLYPKKTAQAVREDVRWIREHTSQHQTKTHAPR